MRYDCAIQFPSHDSFLVSAICDSMWKHLHHQTIGALPDDDATRYGGDRLSWAATRCGEPCQWKCGYGQCPPRSSTYSRSYVRRIFAGCTAYLLTLGC